EDNSTHTLTVVLATAFVISMMTGLVAMFSPCFEGHFLYKSLLTTTNKDNQTETAFNATIVCILNVMSNKRVMTAGAIFATTKRLMAEENGFHKRIWFQPRVQTSNIPSFI
ncbi:unnamed protein product, partial [Medioppia subpectinata]